MHAYSKKFQYKTTKEITKLSAFLHYTKGNFAYYLFCPESAPVDILLKSI